MSRIDDLIKQHCPDGVEFRKIWELTAWDKRFNAVENSKQTKIIKYPYVLAKALKEMEDSDGNVYLLATGTYEGWTTKDKAGQYLSKGEVVTIPWGGVANVQYYKGEFVTADNRLATSLNTDILSNKYLYYFMLNSTNLIQSFYRGSGIKHPSMAQVLDMDIPIPPLPVQLEIVDILDKFIKLEAELEAELEDRQKQYTHYRDGLLSYSHYNFRQITLGDIGDVKMCKRILKNQTKSNEEIPFYKIGTFGKNPDSFISQELYEQYVKKYSFPKKGDVLISASGTIGRTVVYDGKPAYFQDSNIVWIDNNEEIVTNKYLEHFYRIIKWDVSSGGTINRLYNSNLKKTKIVVPCIEEQNRIVAILDKFDALVNDISSGLPAEITARRQQYEYYRNKLLTFRELLSIDEYR